MTHLSASDSVQKVRSINVFHWSTLSTNACFLILSLVSMFTLPGDGGRGEGGGGRGEGGEGGGEGGKAH